MNWIWGIKGIYIGKEKVKLVIFENMGLYIEYLKFLLKKFIRSDKFRKVVGCKINIKKGGCFFYISNKFDKKSFRSNFIYKMLKNLSKIFMNKLELKDFYSEN